MRLFVTGRRDSSARLCAGPWQVTNCWWWTRAAGRGAFVPLYQRRSLRNRGRWKSAVRDFEPAGLPAPGLGGIARLSPATSLKNFQAGLGLFQLLREIGCPRLVVTGTCFEYGDLSGCLAEDRHPQTQGLFAAFKAAQRLVATSLLPARQRP